MPHPFETSMRAAKASYADGQSRITVWLVEDNETFRNTVSRALARNSAIVEQAWALLGLDLS